MQKLPIQCLVYLLFGLLLITSKAFAWVNKLPKVALPDNASLAWVSNNINHNGVAMSIQSFTSTQDVSQVFDFYRQQWARSDSRPGYMENDVDGWAVISQLQREHSIALQLKPGSNGGSEGFLSIAAKDGLQAMPDHDIPVPSGAQEISSSYVEEHNTQAFTNIYLSQDDAGSVASFYRSRMKVKGWSLANEERIEGQHILLFDKKGDRCEFVVGPSENNGSIVFVNKVSVNG